MRVVVLQRMVPHYRRALFSKLHERYGWIVAADHVAEKSGIPGVTDAPWLKTFKFSTSKRNEYRAWVPTAEIVDTLRPDAVIAEFSPNMSSTWWLSAQAALGRGPRLIFWSQGWNVERGFRRPVDLAIQAARLALMRPADGQVCYSEAGAAYLRRWMPYRQEVFTAANTLDVSQFPGRFDIAKPSDEAHLLFVGRLTPDKNVPLLVDMVAAAQKRVPGLRLTVIGEGADLEVVRAKAEHTPGIEILGAVYDKAELARHFQRATLFVYAGSIGLAANQALAYGLPVMIFDSPPHGTHHPEHEYVVDGHTGFRVSGSDRDAFIARLVSEFSQPSSPRERLEPQIRAYVDARLTLDSMISGFAGVESFLRRVGPRT